MLRNQNPRLMSWVTSARNNRDDEAYLLAVVGALEALVLRLMVLIVTANAQTSPDDDFGGHVNQDGVR
jgi:hypothetical protein